MTLSDQSEFKGKRRRRFQRDPSFRSPSGRAGHFELQARDLDIITAIARHRFLNTEQICLLFGCDCPRVESEKIRGGVATKVRLKAHRPGCSCICKLQGRKGTHETSCLALLKSDKHIASRLLELFQAGYLERPFAQLQLRVRNGAVTAGSVPMAYAASNAGLALIGEDRRNSLSGKLSWATKTTETTRLFLEHTLKVADVHVGVDVSVRRNPRFERLPESVLMSGMNAERKASARPFALRSIYKGQMLTTICDAAFAVGDKTARRRWNVLVEVDLGHMPVERTDLSQTSILRKLLGYAKAYDEGLHKTELGWKGLRIVILTTSEARVRSCVKAAQDRFGSAAVGRIFLFGTLDVARDILNASFVDISGKTVRLFDEI